MHVCYVHAQVSVPDGATAGTAEDKDKPVPEPALDKQFKFLWSCREVLDGVRMSLLIIYTRIMLAKLPPRLAV